MEELIERWQRAAERARDEQVRVIALDNGYRATSSSRALGSYRLEKGPEGWMCECVANAEYGVPCKHLWALADALGLDVLTDIRLNWELFGESTQAA